MSNSKPITLEDNVAMVKKLIDKFRKVQNPELLTCFAQPCYRKALLHLELAVQEFEAAEYFRAREHRYGDLE